MGWRKKVEEYAARKNRVIILTEAGIGVEFSDGCDVFWILPGEPASTLPLSIHADVDPADVTTIYERIDTLRSEALHIVRHYYAENGYHLSRSLDGEWWYSSNVISGEIDVGESLTVACRESSTAAEALTKWDHFQWMPDRPAPDRLTAWLKEPLPAEAPAPGEDQRTDSGITEAARWLGSCSRMSALADMSPDELKQYLADGISPQPEVPGRFIDALAEHLPDVEACVELCSDDRLRLQFSDELDVFTVRVNSHLLRRIKREGPEAVALSIAEDYHHQNQRRAKTLNAIWAAAEKSGRKVEQLTTCLSGGQNVCHIGQISREISFAAGRRLTVRLRNLSPEETFRQTFVDDAWFAERCFHEYPDAPDNLRGPLRFGNLTPRDVPTPPELPELTESVISQTDELARKAIDNLFAEPQVMHRYRDRNFIGEHDTWFDSSRWTKVALDNLSNEQWSDSAAVILLEAGDPRAVPVARKIVAARKEPHHEESDDVVELIWRLRHEFPDIAGKWLGPDTFRSCYHDRLVSLGDPVSIRREQARIQSATAADTDDDDDLTAEQITSMKPEMAAQIHSQFRQWARETHLLAPMDYGRLQIASDMSWYDVFADLESNPWLLSTWLTSAERSEQFDEPGLLLSSESILIWSGALPTRFMAKIVARAFASDLVSLAVQAAQTSASKNPAERNFLPQCSHAYQNMNRSLQSNLAIAWFRYRESEN